MTATQQVEILTDLWIPGRPKPKGSLKNIAPRGRPARLVEQVEGSTEWKRKVRNAVVREVKGRTADIPLPQFPIAEAVEVTAKFHFDPPAGPTYALYPCGLEGDTDKLCRNVGDALQESRLITDDRFIVRWVAEKGWTYPGVLEGLQLSVRLAP